MLDPTKLGLRCARQTLAGIICSTRPPLVGKRFRSVCVACSIHRTGQQYVPPRTSSAALYRRVLRRVATDSRRDKEEDNCAEQARLVFSSSAPLPGTPRTSPGATTVAVSGASARSRRKDVMDGRVQGPDAGQDRRIEEAGWARAQAPCRKVTARRL